MSDKKKYDEYDYDSTRIEENHDNHLDDHRNNNGKESLQGNQNYYGRQVDVVLVGIGGGGGMALEIFTGSGTKVVALEKGPYIPDKAKNGGLSRELFTHDELRKSEFNAMLPNSGDYPQTWRPDDSEEATGGRFVTCAEMVGGGVVHYATHCLRPHPSDFNRLSAFGPLPGANVADWPITYDALEPFITEAEYIIGTSGDADTSNPYEPPRSRPFPNPPLGRKLGDVLLTKAAKRVGQTVYPMPSSARSRKYDGGKACHHCSFCSGYMCDEGAKGNALVANVPHALKSGNAEIRPNCYVTRVIIDASGRCTGVEYIETTTGKYHVQEAKIVVLAATAPVTTQILLNSAGQHGLFPDGLGNTSGLLGKNYLSHISGYVAGYVNKNLDNFIGIMGNSANQDSYEPDPSRGHIGSAAIITGGGSTSPIASAGNNYPGTAAPLRKWGLARKQYLRNTYGNDIASYVQCEETAVLSNQIDLDPVVVDKWGIPVPRLTKERHPNDIAVTNFASERTKEIFDAVDGIVSVWGGGKPSDWNGRKQSVHQGGTARMGNDPSTSVTNKHCQFHDVPNLFVCDGSPIVTMPAVCLSLTIQAIGCMVGDYIVNNRGSI